MTALRAEAVREDDPAVAALDWLKRFLAEISVSPQQEALLATALVGLADQVADIRSGPGWAPFVDYPVAVFAAETGRAPPPALPAACSLVFLGLDILDDLADGDLPAHWAGRDGAEINLAAATILTTLPPLILAGLDAAPATRVRMQRALAAGLLRMSAGQQADLAFTGQPAVAPDAVEASVVGKSGEQQATYCALAAELAGAPPDRVAAYAELGRCLGTAGQLASDCQELLCDPRMRDLAQGTRTLPIALHLARLDEPARSAFLALLDEAQHEDAARRAARDELRARAAFRRTLFRAEIYRQRGRAAAVLACPDAARRRALGALFEDRNPELQTGR